MTKYEQDVFNVFCLSDEQAEMNEWDESDDEQEAYKELHKFDDIEAEPNPQQQDMN